MRWLILIGVLYVAWRLVKSVSPAVGGGGRRTVQRPGDAGIDVMVQDPVCGVYFPKREGVTVQRGGEEIIFCSNECKNKYLSNKQ
ncbi:MAG: hypothetical protein ABIL58_04475 [Pseudomonadota bacterium]